MQNKIACILLLLLKVCVSFDLTLIHTNDVHDRIEQFESRNGNLCSIERAAAGKCFGGVSRRLTKVQEIRSQHKNTLFLDAGDQFIGTSWFTTYGGFATRTFMNALHYDAMSFGNHEFDRGIDGLVEFLTNLTFPVICTNINTDNEPSLQGLYKKSHTFQIAGEMIGIVGYVTPQTAIISNPGPNISFVDEISALKPEVQRLQNQGINKIIAVGHSGFQKDLEIAAQVEGLDVIVGGHTDTFLYTGPPPSEEKPFSSYPHVVTHKSGEKVLVVQDYTFGKYLGYLRTTWDTNGVITNYSGNPILLDASIKQDVELEKTVQKWAEKVRLTANEPIGSSRVYLEGARSVCRLQECNLGNLIADAMVRNYSGTYTDGQWARFGLALINGGGIRTTVVQGRITRGTMNSVQPFKNTIVAITVTGSVLRQAFEHSVRGFDPIDQHGKFLQISGFKVVYDITKPDGNRVVSISVRCVKCLIPEFKDLDDDQQYEVLMYNFFANGGDGYAMFKNNRTNLINFGNLDVESTVHYVQKFSPVMADVDGRITIINATSNGNLKPTTCTGSLRSISVLFVLLLLIIASKTP